MADLDSSQKRSAAWIIAAQSCTKLGDVLTNPKTVLTWLLSQLGAPGAVISMLVPVRESGSMLPQLFISGLVKRRRRRKWVFVAGALAQAAAVAAMGGVALLLPPAAAGLGVLAAVALFSIARAFCSISSKDVLGRTIPKGFRGRVGGISNAISGVVSMLAALGLVLLGGRDDAGLLAALVLGASSLWVLGAACYARVDEPPREPRAEEDLGADLKERLRLVRSDRLFRRFIIARSLLLGSALASPLLVVLAQQGGGRMSSLVGFVVASGVASATSSFFWGALADRAAHRAMTWGGLVATAVGLAALGIGLLAPPWSAHPLVWPAMFLLFNVGYQGVRLGRKTWVVDAAEGDRRTDYVSASNTLIAVMVLVLGALASPLQALSPLLPLGLFSALCLAGALVALGLDSRAAR